MNKPKPTAKGTAAAKRAWDTIKRDKGAKILADKEGLPPHSLEAEEAALSCVIQVGDAGSQQNVDAMLYQLRPVHFYEHRTKTLHHAMVQMRSENRAVDFVTVNMWLKVNKREGELMTYLEECGGTDYVKHVWDQSPNGMNFNSYFTTLEEYRWRRFSLNRAADFAAMAKAQNCSMEELQALTAELHEMAVRLNTGHLPLIQLVTPEQARAYEPDENDFMVGQGLISRGMFVTIGGEPGVGKSRLATTLAIAGARGTNSWLNYPIRSQWRTLVLQSENDAQRLKEECDAIPRQFNDWIKFTNGLSHGMAFDKPEFRRELRRIYDAWPFDMLVVDPWNDVSSEEGQKDYKEALLNIQACFRGAKMPAVVIVAHLRKRGRDDNGKRKSGRELLHELSGSLALGSTSRTVIVVQAASADMEDARVICEVAKANNVKPEWFGNYGGSRSAWKRANGAFEAIKDFDWQEYENPGAPERRLLEEEMIREVFEGAKPMKPARLAKELKQRYEVGESTTFRAIGPRGYLAHLFDRQCGLLTLKNGTNGHARH